MRYVLDTSVAVKWFFTDEELSEKSQEVLSLLIEKPDSFVVPELFYIELAAVLTRKSGADAKFCSSAISKLYSLGIKTVGTSGELLTEAIELSCQTGVSVYDTIYCALAKYISGSWLTADGRAIEKLKSFKDFNSLHLQLFGTQKTNN